MGVVVLEMVGVVTKWRSVAVKRATNKTLRWMVLTSEARDTSKILTIPLVLP